MNQDKFYIKKCIIKMGNNYKLKEIDIKNRTCCYFDDIKTEDFDPNNVLTDEKPYENILVFNISYKRLIDSMPLRIRFAKIDGFIRVFDWTRYLALFGSKKYDSICTRIRYISQKKGITYITSHNFAKIKVDSYDSLI